MAISITRELAHRLEMNNNRLRAALSEVQRLREEAHEREAGAVPVE
jgi:hypothetical protein